jgi:hypothetical protein
MKTASGHALDTPVGERDTTARATRKQLEARMRIQFQAGFALIADLMGQFERWECVQGNPRSADSQWELKERRAA